MKIINKLVALAGMAMLTGLATSCQNEDIACADNGQPLPLNLSATLAGGQGSGELTRAGEEGSVAMNIPDGTTLTIHYYKTAEGISGVSRQYALYTTTRQVDGSGAVSYALNLSDGYKDIIDYTRGKDYTLRSYAANKFSISQPRTDGNSGNYDVPFYSIIGSSIQNPAITANSATRKAPYTLQIKLLFAGMRFQFKLADDLKLAGYTAQFIDFTPMMGDTEDPTLQADRRASLAATSCAVMGAVNTNVAVSGGATAGILTVKFTNVTEGITEERKLRITLPIAGIATPEAGKLYTYNVTVDRKEALTAQTVQIASFTTANGNGNGEDIIQGGDGKLNWTYDFAGMTTDQIAAQITQIKSRMANIVVPGGTSDGIVALTLNNLGALPDEAFKDCKQLGTVTLPTALTVGQLAFNGCTSLTGVSFPKVTYIKSVAFENCKLLTNVNSPAVTQLGEGVFINCYALTKVDLPAVTQIGVNSFGYCTSLSSVNLPEALSIGESAFAYCTSLINVELPKAKKITGGTFFECTYLTSVSLPAATTIGNNTFEKCSALTTIKLTSVESITLSTDVFRSFTNFANCTLYLNADKQNGTGSVTPLVEADGFTWGGVTWKAIQYE